MHTPPDSLRRRLLAAGSIGAAALAAPGLAGAQARANWPKTLTLGTASVGGTYFIYGGWAQLAGEKTGVNISTRQTQGPNQNIILTDSKEIELGMTTMGVALQAWEGSEKWTQGKKFRNIRAIFPMYDTPFHFIALKKSNISSVKQLAGRNVGVGPRAGTPGTYFPLMFDALGVKATIRNGQASDMASQLQDGIIDCFAFAAGTPISAYAEIEATNPVTFFTFTGDEIRTLKTRFPELSDSTIPKGSYKSLTEDHATVGLFNFAIAHKDLPDDLVHEIVSAVMENNAAMVKIHAAAKETIPQNAVRNAFLPFHPGAAKYFQDKGIKLADAVIPR